MIGMRRRDVSMISALAVSESFAARQRHSFLATERPGDFAWNLLQLGVFGLGGDEDGDVGVGVFPQRQKILIGRLGLGGVALQGISAGNAEIRECSDGFVEHNPAMAEDFLELGGGFAALIDLQIRFPAYIDWIEAQESEQTGRAQLVSTGGLKRFNGFRRIVWAEHGLSANRLNGG